MAVELEVALEVALAAALAVELVVALAVVSVTSALVVVCDLNYVERYDEASFAVYTWSNYK